MEVRLPNSVLLSCSQDVDRLGSSQRPEERAVSLPFSSVAAFPGTQPLAASSKPHHDLFRSLPAGLTSPSVFKPCSASLLQRRLWSQGQSSHNKILITLESPFCHKGQGLWPGCLWGPLFGLPPWPIKRGGRKRLLNTRLFPSPSQYQIQQMHQWIKLVRHVTFHTMSTINQNLLTFFHWIWLKYMNLSYSYIPPMVWKY